MTCPHTEGERGSDKPTQRVGGAVTRPHTEGGRGSDMPHSHMDMGRESATHLMHKVGGESDRPTHPEELAFHKRDQVHYPDQRFVHNIIMVSHIVTNLALTQNLTLTLTVNVIQNAGRDNAPDPTKAAAAFPPYTHFHTQHSTHAHLTAAA